MSISVELADLADRVSECGPVAFLVTVGDRGPHVVSVTASLEDGTLACGAGRTTSANATASPRVTLQWPSVPSQPGYALLVDGDAEVIGGADPQLRITPDRAVLHRLADAAGDGPGCITVLDLR